MKPIDVIFQLAKECNLPIQVVAYILGVSTTLYRWRQEQEVSTKIVNRLKDLILTLKQLRASNVLPVRTDVLMYYGLIHLTECGVK